MRTKLMLAALAGVAMIAPGIAQTTTTTTVKTTGAVSAPTRELPYDRGYDKPTARADAVNAQEGPVTDSLNAQANGAAATTAETSTANQAQYDVDRQSYLDALVQHDRAVNRTDARYMRQQRAYADAMAVWRVQVQECKKGHQRACQLPPPNVSDYY